MYAQIEDVVHLAEIVSEIQTKGKLLRYPPKPQRPEITAVPPSIHNISTQRPCDAFEAALQLPFSMPERESQTQ